MLTTHVLTHRRSSATSGFAPWRRLRASALFQPPRLQHGARIPLPQPMDRGFQPASLAHVRASNRSPCACSPTSQWAHRVGRPHRHSVRPPCAHRSSPRRPRTSASRAAGPMGRGPPSRRCSGDVRAPSSPPPAHLASCGPLPSPPKQPAPHRFGLPRRSCCAQARPACRRCRRAGSGPSLTAARQAAANPRCRAAPAWRCAQRCARAARGAVGVCWCPLVPPDPRATAGRRGAASGRSGRRHARPRALSALPTLWETDTLFAPPAPRVRRAQAVVSSHALPWTAGGLPHRVRSRRSRLGRVRCRGGTSMRGCT